MAAVASGRRGDANQSAAPTSAAGTAAPPRRAHQIGCSPGRRLSNPPGRCPQIGYSSAVERSATVGGDPLGSAAHSAGIAGWKA